MLPELVQVGLVVERGWRSQRTKQQSRNVVAALDERAAGIDVVEVAAERKLAANLLRALQPEAGAVVFVIRTLDDAVLIGESDRRVEGRPVITAGQLNVVISGKSRFEQLADVIVGWRAGGQLCAPRSATSGRRTVRRIAARRCRIRDWHPARQGSLRVVVLQEIHDPRPVPRQR